MVVVTRKDLTPGHQAVQAAHAAIDFQHQYPNLAKIWHANSNYLVFLATENEFTLEDLIRKARSKDISFSIFREPDLENQITAVAFQPCENTRKICSHLPLILKNS